MNASESHRKVDFIAHAKPDNVPELIPESGKAYDEMEKSEDKYRVMVDVVPALLWRNLPDGSNEFLNQQWHDYTGVSPASGQR